MLFEFSVVVQGGGRVGVVGSLEALGCWDPDRGLDLVGECRAGVGYYSGIVEIDGCCILEKKLLDGEDSVVQVGGNLKSFEYKFVIRESVASVDDFNLPPAKEAGGVELTWSGFLYKESDFEDKSGHPVLSRSEDAASNNVIWEGESNRRVFLDPFEAGKSRLDHGFDSANFMRFCGGDLVYVLPCVEFDYGGGTSEFDWTGRYYQKIKRDSLIHFDRMFPRVYCGTCPRRLGHLNLLRDKYGVGMILNLQTEADIRENWIVDLETKRTACELSDVCESTGLQFIHLPTNDMCSKSRSRMMAQGAWLLAGYLVANPEQNVYVHCNAGVGRAIACCSGFLHFCLNLGLQETIRFVKRRRYVAFVDAEALRRGKIDFDKKYAKAALCLPLIGKKF